MFGAYWDSVTIFLGINVLMALSLYVPMSAGLISLGQGGFMAIGAYTSAVLTIEGVPFIVAVPIGALASAVVGILVGAPALRIRGMYLIILTLGFGEIVRIVFLNFEPTGGAGGLKGIPPMTGLWSVGIACAIAFVVVWQLRRARLGRAMIAVHEDDVAAEAMGISLLRIKVMAFSLGAFFAGVAGGLYAHHALFVEPNDFDFHRSAVAFLYVVLGGPANPLGPVVGAAFVTLLPEVLRVVQDWRMTFFGLLLVMAAIWRPDGLLRAPKVR
jgi:branched-chain amino acid transport system permease protein